MTGDNSKARPNQTLDAGHIHAEGLLIRAESAVDSLQPENFGQFGWAR
jgi:hypothetical protein